MLGPVMPKMSNKDNLVNIPAEGGSGVRSEPLSIGESKVQSDAQTGMPARFSLASAFKCAWDGILYTVRTQRNMKIHLILAIVAIVLGFGFRIDKPSWLAVILCIGAVISAECVNTALESVVDLVSPEYHELARRAKDCGAGAVLVFALVSLVVAAVVFGPRIGSFLLLSCGWSF